MNHQNVILDSLVFAITTICAAATNALLAEAPATDLHELRLLLLPFIGALVASGGMIMFNPEPETRRIVIGRSIFALFAGACGPSIAGMIHPVMEQLRPVAMLVSGAGIAGLVFVLSRPFCRKLYERADRLAERQLDIIEDGIATRAEARQAKHEAKS